MVKSCIEFEESKESKESEEAKNAKVADVARIAEAEKLRHPKRLKIGSVLENRWVFGKSLIFVKFAKGSKIGKEYVSNDISSYESFSPQYWSFLARKGNFWI